MYLEIEFSLSAFKHGATEEDIRNALITLLYDEAWTSDESKFLLIGFDLNQALIEVMYVITDDATVLVFHAMKCRKEYLNILGGNIIQ